MKQIFQNLRSGRTDVSDVPVPACRDNCLIVRVGASLISAGTERMLVEFSRASLLSKARSKPDKVRQVLDKIKADGLLPTLDAVFRKLDEPLPLGYCAAGEVVEVGSRISDISIGDRVACASPHAEFVCVPRNLCEKIPADVSDEAACFTVLSSIALEGTRLLDADAGECCAVYGLGLIGLVAVQLLVARGMSVIGLDVNRERLKLAESFGAKTLLCSPGTDVPSAVMNMTDQKGVGCVLVTASAKNDDIIHNSAGMSRKRGKIVLVGIADLNIQRADFYKKELSFQVSCSYGPGRYDDEYEQATEDIPVPHAGWTLRDNLRCVLEDLRNDSVKVEELISGRFAISDAGDAYDKLAEDRDSLGIVLIYGEDSKRCEKIEISPPARESVPDRAIIGIIGAGNFTSAALLPALTKTDARLAYISSRGGADAANLARKFKVENAVTDHKIILHDERVNAVIITTRHDSHARLTVESLRAGKNVLVEKPLALNAVELREVVAAGKDAHGKTLTVGFNRRFSPHAIKMKQLLSARTEPLAMTMTVNAGAIPADHWTCNPKIGGGRIIGEACHFIDLMVFLSGGLVRSVCAMKIGHQPTDADDRMSIVLKFDDGSIGTINYFANGHKSYPKESLEVFSDGRVLKMENFRRLIGYGFAGFGKFKSFRQDKGHSAEISAFVDSVSIAAKPLIPMSELVNVTLASFAAVTSAGHDKIVNLRDEFPDFPFSSGVEG